MDVQNFVWMWFFTWNWRKNIENDKTLESVCERLFVQPISGQFFFKIPSYQYRIYCRGIKHSYDIFYLHIGISNMASLFWNYHTLCWVAIWSVEQSTQWVNNAECCISHTDAELTHCHCPLCNQGIIYKPDHFLSLIALHLISCFNLWYAELFYKTWNIFAFARADSRFAPSQWETATL